MLTKKEKETIETTLEVTEYYLSDGMKDRLIALDFVDAENAYVYTTTISVLGRTFLWFNSETLIHWWEGELDEDEYEGHIHEYLNRNF